MSLRRFERLAHAKVYLQHRPNYPPQLYDTIASYVREKLPGPLDVAVDVGCGSGQGTRPLATIFKRVIGVDVSEAQVHEAVNSTSNENVEYRVGSGEVIPVETSSVALVTVATAVHWFDLAVFFKEVDRVLKPGGCVALYLLAVVQIRHPTKGEELNDLLWKFYKSLKWTDKVDFIEKNYSQVALPYDETSRIMDRFCIEKNSTVENFLGYLKSWSGYQDHMADNPDDDSLEKLQTSFLSILESAQSAADTPLSYEWKVPLLLSRKPIS